MYQKLADDHPLIPDHVDNAANTGNNLSIVLRRLGRMAESRDHSERAVALMEALVKQFPGNRGYRESLAEDLFNRGLTRRALGDLSGAPATSAARWLDSAPLLT